ncbi:MAG: transposase [Firmicutes bacterium]|nr:transposase [Bacillota bacterium]
MFKENNAHLQEEMFNSYSSLHPKIQKRLKKTWAPIFYEHVFCQIDETLFAPLYSLDNGRPNFPVNILLSLEFIKHLKDYTDEELIEQFYYNYQIMYALGLRNLGQLYLALRTFYEFRERVYRYAVESLGKDDLIFAQFEKLTAHFLEVAQINTKEQRMDSTQVRANIKRAGRLSLAYDVLEHAVKACPLEILPEELKRLREPEYRTEVLYRSKGNQAQSRLQEVLNLGAQLLEITASSPSLLAANAIGLLERFLQEQATLDHEQHTWIAKAYKDIAPSSLQSAHDPDATYRKKAGQGQAGYVANLAETCAEENPVQFISDYTLEKNNVSDPQMRQERLPVIREKMAVTDLYTDGAYYSPEVEEQAPGITMHYTNMSGSKPAPEKLPWTAFGILDQQIIVSCPNSQHPAHSYFDKQGKTLSAYFDLHLCQQCPMREACPVKFQKKSAVLRVSQKAVSRPIVVEGLIHNNCNPPKCLKGISCIWIKVTIDSPTIPITSLAESSYM